MTTSFANRVGSLQYDSEKQERIRLLYHPHMKPLTELVNIIRKERNLSEEVPCFDPCDGGVNARVLFLLEAPGKKAKESGFISRNNNDKSAEKMLTLLKRSGIAREDTLLWNIVPWYLGDDDKIRAATDVDLQEGIVYLEKLLPLLPKLSAIVLVGKKAQKGFSRFQGSVNARIFNSSHPSPSNVNSRPSAEDEILASFKEVFDFLSH